MSGAQRVTVYVVDYGRKFLQLQWIDPRTGKRRTKSSGCTRRREAERAAAALEEKLNAAEPVGDGSITWNDFVLIYIQDHGSGLAAGTQSEIHSFANTFERLVEPGTLRFVTASLISKYVGLRRQPDPETGTRVAEDTIRKDLRHLKAMLRWAVDQRHIAACPKIPRIPRARKGREMKGRPITLQEFVRMLRAVESVAPEQSTAWRHFLKGLWLSGLRLDESLKLRWEPGPWLSIDISDPRHPALRIPGRLQKSGEDQILPLTHDFGRFLARTPKAERSGPVFNPCAANGKRYRNKSDVIRTVGDIGRAAGVIVDPVTGKHASAHDLRRSFGTRWAMKVPPMVLREIMRHSTVLTSEKYYVGQSRDQIHAILDRATQQFGQHR